MKKNARHRKRLKKWINVNWDIWQKLCLHWFNPILMHSSSEPQVGTQKLKPIRKTIMPGIEDNTLTSVPRFSIEVLVSVVSIVPEVSLTVALTDWLSNAEPVSQSTHWELDKFQGNLSINEYRSLSANDSLLLIVNKPLTRVMPELHEDNVLSSTNVSDNNYALKRNIKRKNKSNIMTENFGFN